MLTRIKDRLRRGSLPNHVRSGLRPLLPLPELPAADRERIRDQPADRGRSRGVPRRRAGSGRRAPRRRQHADDLRCPNCQVAVYSTYGRSDVLFVRGGTLDEPRASRPTSTSTRGRSSPGSDSPTRRPRSRRTTTRRRFGRPPASSAPRRARPGRRPGAERPDRAAARFGGKRSEAWVVDEKSLQETTFVQKSDHREASRTYSR